MPHQNKERTLDRRAVPVIKQFLAPEWGESEDFMKKVKKSNKNMQANATTRKAGNKVAGTQKHLTPAELTFVAKFIADFSEIYVTSEKGEEPRFSSSEVEMVCSGEHKTWTRDLLILPVENLGCFVLSAKEVQEHIRKGSPSLLVGEVLVSWFNEYYLPRIKRLPNIYSKLLSNKKTWKWLEKAASLDEMYVDNWVRIQILGQRDRLLDGIVKRINEIKYAIECELFDGDDIVGLPDEFDIVINKADVTSITRPSFTQAINGDSVDDDSSVPY